MATIKAYTNIEQSRKLVEILSADSADGFWEYHYKWYSEGDEWEGYEDYPRAEPYLEYTRKENEWKEDKSDIPCWSLAALLGVIPCGQVNKMADSNKYEASSWNDSDFEPQMYVEGFDNSIDACYNLILKLHELNLL